MSSSATYESPITESGPNGWLTPAAEERLRLTLCPTERRGSEKSRGRHVDLLIRGVRSLYRKPHVHVADILVGRVRAGEPVEVVLEFVAMLAALVRCAAMPRPADDLQRLQTEETRAGAELDVIQLMLAKHQHPSVLREFIRWANAYVTRLNELVHWCQTRLDESERRCA